MKFICFICTILLLLSATGCNTFFDRALPPEVFDSEYFLEKANEVTVTEDSVIFNDAVSSEAIVIKKNPQRVACLFPSFTTLWYEVGGTVVGCIGGASAELYAVTIGRDITTDPNVTVIGLTAAGKSWDVESLIALDCDLIICSRSMNGYTTVADIAKSAGIPIFCAEYNNFSDYLKWFKVFAHLAGSPHLWDEIALPTLEAVVSIVNEHRDTDITVLPIFAGTTSIKASTSSTMIGEMLVQLGATNIADSADIPGDLIDISLEHVLMTDPDVILVQCHASNELAQSQIEASLAANPIWNSLSAVKNGRVVYLDKSLFHNKPNRRFVDAYEKLSEILYNTEASN